MGEANQALLQKYANSFQAIYPNVTVVIPAGVGNYDTLKNNMINAITANAMPNLVQAYPDHVAEYLNGKAVINLDPYIQSTLWGLNGADAFEDIILSYRQENSQYDTAGTFYSLPFNKSTEVMIYNKTAFDALDLETPETWQDIIAAAPQLKAYGDQLAEQKVRAANTDKTEQELQVLIAAAKNLIVPASYDSTGNAFITFTRQFNGAYTGINFTNFSGQYLWVNNTQTTAAMTFLKDNKQIITASRILEPAIRVRAVRQPADVRDDRLLRRRPLQRSRRRPDDAAADLRNRRRADSVQRGSCPTRRPSSSRARTSP
ncbi:MAG: extracellular solute-binding protein [Desulfomicrobium escambiense]|nr:extracellular solute-binding protein [Desulfomicrobium escambiense]